MFKKPSGFFHNGKDGRLFYRGAHCAPLMHQSMGTVDQGMVRFSFSWFNTEEEIDAAVKALKELAE